MMGLASTGYKGRVKFFVHDIVTCVTRGHEQVPKLGVRDINMKVQ